MKLHLGCGGMYLKGWINVDLNPTGEFKVDVVADVRHLPFKDNCTEVLLNYHVIEHVHFLDALKMLKEWHRVLKSEGWLIIECPDLIKTMKAFFNNSIPFDRFYINLYGQPWYPGQAHYYGWFPAQLKWALSETGFGNFVEKPAKRYIDLYKWCMHIEAQKL